MIRGTACPHGVWITDVSDCNDCFAEHIAFEQQHLRDLAERARQRVCPDCHGTALSPYPDDGGSCPHCFGGYLR